MLIVRCADTLLVLVLLRNVLAVGNSCLLALASFSSIDERGNGIVVHILCLQLAGKGLLQLLAPLRLGLVCAKDGQGHDGDEG